MRQQGNQSYFQEQSVERPGRAYARALHAELRPTGDRLRQIAKVLDLEVREVEADGFDGALIRAKELPVGAIAVRRSIREAGRKNFTIAHEIGHFVLPGHDQACVACTATEVGNWTITSTERELEREANEFAAELLMPGDLVGAFMSGATPSLGLIQRIAGEFGASLSAAAWRYCDVAPNMCAIVWSTDRVIQWVKRSPNFPLFVPGGCPIQEGTFAAACFAEEKVPAGPRAVPIDLWAKPASIDSAILMHEESKALPGYRSVITLLWLRNDEP